MAIIDMQKELNVLADGWWGDNSQTAMLAQGRCLDLNWAYLRRKLDVSFSQSQVDGMNFLRDACNKAKLSPQHAAYIFATAWHESAKRMQPVSEFGKGAKHRYGQWFKNSRGVKNGVRNGAKNWPRYLYSEYPHLYYGRGLSQLTWLDNYIRATEELGVDFANNPEIANKPEHSADILVTGSMQGWFTTRSIPQKITYGHFQEFIDARGVINGKDKAKMIAEYAKIFLTGMELKAL